MISTRRRIGDSNTSWRDHFECSSASTAEDVPELSGNHDLFIVSWLELIESSSLRAFQDSRTRAYTMRFHCPPPGGSPELPQSRLLLQHFCVKAVSRAHTYVELFPHLPPSPRKLHLSNCRTIFDKNKLGTPPRNAGYHTTLPSPVKEERVPSIQRGFPPPANLAVSLRHHRYPFRLYRRIRPPCLHRAQGTFGTSSQGIPHPSHGGVVHRRQSRPAIVKALPKVAALYFRRVPSPTPKSLHILSNQSERGEAMRGHEIVLRMV